MQHYYYNNGMLCQQNRKREKKRFLVRVCVQVHWITSIVITLLLAPSSDGENDGRPVKCIYICILLMINCHYRSCQFKLEILYEQQG